MKDRPILFSGPMVNAILDGRKTMTRRIIKPQPCIDDHGHFCWNGWNFGKDFSGPHIQAIASPRSSSKTKRVLCPYGKPGDQLWVRETWGLWDTQPSDGPEHAQLFYRATDGEKHHMRGQLWRPSIFMPRWASRITLEITSVRVERLIDITALDCRNEGFIGETYRGEDPYSWFRRLWNSINGKKYPWQSNPWVWVIEFRRTV